MHQCLSCKKLYEDDKVPVLDGCSCGGRMFLFVKHTDDIERADEVYEELKTKVEKLDQEKETIEKEQIKPSEKEIPKPKPKFGVETVKVVYPGVYEINLQALMEGEPIVVLAKGGSYIISLPSVFGRESEIELE